MQTQEQTAPTLGEYVGITELLQIPGIAKHYPTLDSARWFIRKHYPLLVARRALIVVAGRQQFHPDRFEQAVIEAGLLVAAGKCGVRHE